MKETNEGNKEAMAQKNVDRREHTAVRDTVAQGNSGFHGDDKGDAGIVVETCMPESLPSNFTSAVNNAKSDYGPSKSGESSQDAVTSEFLEDEETQSLLSDGTPEDGNEGQEETLFRRNLSRYGDRFFSDEGDGSVSRDLISGQERLSDEVESEAGTCSNSSSSTDDSSAPFVPRLDTTPQRGLLKRRREDADEDCGVARKKKRTIAFDGVTVFYFPRAQGFTCVPSQGGSTLGMGRHHTQVKKFSLGEHAEEQKRQHKIALKRLQEQQLEHEGSDGVLPGSAAGASETDVVLRQDSANAPTSEVDDPDEVKNNGDPDSEIANYYFLQPVPTRQRRVLLREAGVKKIDSVEKEECQDIRSSREHCGCSCKTHCEPDSCGCAQAGIKCQVDRLSFPCGCTREGCGNQTGRIEFNPIRVRTHFIHTLMKVELEKKEDEQGVDVSAVQESLPATLTVGEMPSVDQMPFPDIQLSQPAVNDEDSPPNSGMPAPVVFPSLPSFTDGDQAEPPSLHSWSGLLSESVSSLNETEVAPCNSSTSPMKDVPFSSTMELESCVNAGNYTNMHQEPPEEVIGTTVPKHLRKVSQMVLHSLEEQTSRDGPVDRPVELDQKSIGADSGTIVIPVQDEDAIFPSVSTETPENCENQHSIIDDFPESDVKSLAATNPEKDAQFIEKMSTRSQASSEGSKPSGTSPSPGLHNGRNVQSMKDENRCELLLNRHGSQQNHSAESGNRASLSNQERPAKRYTLKSGYSIDLLSPGAVERSYESPRFTSTGSNKVRISSYDLRRGSSTVTAKNNMTNGNSLSVERNDEELKTHTEIEKEVTKEESSCGAELEQNQDECNKGDSKETSDRVSDNLRDRGSSEGFSDMIMKKNVEETVSA